MSIVKGIYYNPYCELKHKWQGRQHLRKWNWFCGNSPGAQLICVDDITDHPVSGNEKFFDEVCEDLFDWSPGVTKGMIVAAIVPGFFYVVIRFTLFAWSSANSDGQTNSEIEQLSKEEQIRVSKCVLKYSYFSIGLVAIPLIILLFKFDEYE